MISACILTCQRRRSDALQGVLALGYAELAVADAHKARLLVKELDSAVWNDTGNNLDSLAVKVMMIMVRIQIIKATKRQVIENDV